MSWTAPMTAVAGSVFTAAQFNTFIRDNLNECPAAKALNPGAIFTVSDSFQVTERVIQNDVIQTSQTTGSTTYADLATTGPTVAVDTGFAAIVFTSVFMQNNTATASCAATFEISGATSFAASDTEAARFQAPAANGFGRQAVVSYALLTPGTNTFTMKYRVSGGTGTFANRSLTVIPL